MDGCAPQTYGVEARQDIREKISEHEQRLARLREQGVAVRVAEDTLEQLKRTETIFAQHYRNLGGKPD